MRRLVRRGKTSMPIRTTALSIVQDLPNKLYIAEVEQVWQWVKNNIRYTKDVAGVETLQTPERTLQLQAGDCDDQASLLGALLESIGHPTRFIALAFRPGHYSHVLLETRVGYRNKTIWVPLETTEDKPFGWYPSRPHTRLVVAN